MKKVLGTADLIVLGVASMVGAGIFATIGIASAEAGPSVVILFLITGITCLFSAWCYAELASEFPDAGSAYTYVHRRLGPWMAWMIGWDLFLEYAVGNMAVALSWSDYFCNWLNSFGISLPNWMTISYTEVHALPQQAADIIIHSAPTFGSWYVLLDLPAITITILITGIVLMGVQLSNRLNWMLFLLKATVLLVFIGWGWQYCTASNWSPIFPKGWSGMLNGTAAVFFAYIGFDALTTLSGESKEAGRTIPKAIFWSLGIVTLLYIVLAILLTGMVHPSKLNVGDPWLLAVQEVGWFAFEPWVASTALISMIGVLLVFQMGQPRIWMYMSKDGLLPKCFSSLHPRFNTPHWSVVATGISILLPLLFLNLTTVIELTSIGTILAFTLVCYLVWSSPSSPSAFKVWYINGRYGILCFIIGAFVYLYVHPIQWTLSVKHSIPILLGCCLIVIVIKTIYHQLSLIPTLGLCSNILLLMTMSVQNWLRVLIWLGIGFLFFIAYQRLNKKNYTNYK
ncbi:MAG: amino acid permease [Cytophagaceae bacterium]|jgi:amino acid transporter|nr:amino acid permease [Cytophagaceae bacterium]